METKIDVLIEGAKIPSYQTPGASGVDLCAAIERAYTMLPGERTMIPTGLKMDIPEGYEGQIRPRSGLAVKGISVVNSPGTIDSDYRGEIKVLLINHGNDLFTVGPGDRIAQMVFAPVVRANFVRIARIADNTARGAGGFGSTGTGG